MAPTLVPVAEGIVDLMARETQKYIETTRRTPWPSAGPAS